MIYSVSSYPYYIIKQQNNQQPPVGNRGTTERRRYKDLVCAFDIETTRLAEIEQSIMYIWMVQIEDETIIGRTWDEYKYFIKCCSEQLENDETLVFHVHNLSYEFQFLKGIFYFDSSSVFATDRRKVLKCTLENKKIEFRCSYFHSNRSLDKYLKEMNVETLKKDGKKFNYSKRRFPWTELNDYEMDYCISDVKGLVEAIRKDMKLSNDSYYTFPLTSTGYVRRDVKFKMREIPRIIVKKQLVDYDCYSLLREAFRGGDTHANRYYSGVILENVKSADRSSSYPDVLVNCLFPMGAFFHAGRVTIEELNNLIFTRGKAVLFSIALSGVRLKDDFNGCPYLSKDKSRNTREIVNDNGRIISAEYLETTITDIDYKIIMNDYVFDDICVIDCYYTNYQRLPTPIIQSCKEYFVNKTKLKGIDGNEYEYMKSKNLLNSIYGMMVQAPVKQSIDFLDGNEFIERKDDEIELLNKSNNKAFLAYQWGVWCTAWARYRLRELIWLVGDNFVYCDTDSVKYLNDVDFSKYNKERIKDSKKMGAYAKDAKGKVHYMGVFEDEKPYKYFVTLGAKKYAYKYKKIGRIYVVVSGVTKKYAGAELRAHGGLEAFKPGFIFSKAGGTEAVYNDQTEPIKYMVDGKEIEITSNIVIRDSTYTLGITGEYERILKYYQKGIDDSARL